MAGRHQGSAAVPKVPDVNPWFWTVKILTTAMGEAVSDFLVKEYNPYLAVLAGFIVFAVAITWQFRVPDYRTWPYWTAVAMVAVFGTMVADAMHVGLGVPYKVSVTLFSVGAGCGAVHLVPRRGHAVDPQRSSRRAARSSTG